MFFKTSILLLTGCLVVLVVSCSPKTRSIFFDGVDSGPRPPTTKLRQDLLREIDRLESELAATKQALENAKNARKNAEREPLPVETVRSWTEATDILPTHARTGQIDWNEALRAGTIAPRSGVAPDTPAQAVLDFDVLLARTGSGFMSVTYSHADHTTWLTCGNCHPAIFPLEHGAPKPEMTMDKIRAGEYCGRCHGTVAFGVEDACTRCHPRMP